MTAATTATARARSAPRVAFGAALLLAWVVLTVVWVASTVTSGSLIIKGLIALALMALLAAMEGLEVAVIDRWREMYPERGTKLLAGWLAARQLFVALIVTTATILADRDELNLPGVGETRTPPRSSSSRSSGRASPSCGSRRSSRSTWPRPIPIAISGTCRGRASPSSTPSGSSGCRSRASGRRTRSSAVWTGMRPSRISRRVHRRGARTRSQRPGARSDQRKSMPPAFSRGSSASIQSGTA